MQKEISFMFLILILIFLSITSQITEAKGIIIADDQKVLDIFRDHDQNKVLNLAAKIKEYDRVILHLGARKIFSRGHPFFYSTSKENLAIFAEQLEKQNQDFYLWFLDSFGSSMFLDIYDNHQAIIDDNHRQLEKLDFNYKGIIIDLEWINLGLKIGSENNQAKYLEILGYLNNKFSDKKLYAFMSIVDDQKENFRRGYNEKEILKYLDNIITMLYIKDSGIYLTDGEANLMLKDSRINKLRSYYQANNYHTAVSLEGGIFLERNENLYFIKTTNYFDYHDQSQQFYSKEKNYYRISGYRPKKNINLKRNDGKIIEIKDDDKLHFLEIKADTLIKENDYIWEYFQLQR